jgi:uncharacterized protein (DUF1697 family)
MPRYLAFLRAINVGGHTVKMGRLRQLFEALGFTNVETFIASGNVIFDTRAARTAALEAKIERHLFAALGYEVTTFVRTTVELAAIAAHVPFAPAELADPANGLYIGFLPAVPSPDASARLEALRNPVDDFAQAGRELYWLRRTNLSDPNHPGPPLEKVLAIPMTLRNSTTVRKLAAKYALPATANPPRSKSQ